MTTIWRWGNAFKGQPVRHVSNSYLLWIASNAIQRKLYPDAIRVALAELRRRFADGDSVENDLLGPASDLI